MVQHVNHAKFWGYAPGAFLIMSILPVTVYSLYFTCPDGRCASLTDWSSLPSPPPMEEWFSWEAMLVYVAWFAFQVVLHIVVPGEFAEGTKLADGSRLKYKINAFPIILISVGGAVALAVLDIVPATYLHDNFLQLATASMIFSSSLAVFLYVTARMGLGGPLAHGGRTGNMIYDFFVGHALNPRIGFLDLKCFCELRPGLIGWVLIDLSCAAAQFREFGHVSESMVLVCAFHGYYVFESLYHETAILTTMDICMDGFGFMLAFGDLTWVPFTYSTQARYLAHHDISLSPILVLCIVVLYVGGLYTFRMSNSQKNDFRKDPTHPSVSHLKSMPTARGTKLLISGWWGMARHINYTGDWAMTVAQGLSCGLGHPQPYFLPFYFGLLLIHRCMRDEAECAAKYGKDWKKYTATVPSRFIPGIF